jgi:Cep192 domain 4
MAVEGRRWRLFLRVAVLATLVAFAASVADAATIVAVNHDGAGEGFNDPTPLAPVGGNPGTTRGAQRLNAFQHAAEIWGALLASSVTIRVGANFDPQSCSATSAVLGSAGATQVFRDFAGAIEPGTWYPSALANALHGSDLDAQSDDVQATFNSAIGTTCAFPSVWYYGLDASPPSGQIDFVSVVVHELGHGLGFQTFMSLGSGAKLLGFDDTFLRNLEGHGATPADFPSMSNAQRLAATTDTGNLHWVGANVDAASGVLTGGAVGTHVRMYAPNPQQGGSSVSHWDTALVPDQIMEPIYTGPHHTPGLELPAFQDIGWTVGSVASAPAIDVQPGSKAYGTLSVGSTLDQSFTVKNTGTATLHVSSTSVTNLGQGTSAGEFSITNGAGAFTLAPTATKAVTVRFAPGTAGVKSATLRLASDDPDTANKDVSLSGTGQLVSGPQLTALGPAKVWLGLGSSARGIEFDLSAAVYVDNTLVGTGQLNSVSGGSGTTATKAQLASIPLTLTGGAAAAPSGSALKIQILVRNACSGSTKPSGTARLWFDGQPVDTGRKHGTGSRFNATRAGASSDYYLRSGFALSSTAGSSQTSVDVVVGAPCGSFLPFGTWSITLP